MSGRGKGGKGLGKGGAKRHRKILRDNIRTSFLLTWADNLFRRYHQACHPSSCTSWRCQAYLRSHLRRNSRCPQSLPRGRHPRCRYLHWTRQTKDRHFPRCCIRAQTSRSHNLWFRRLELAMVGRSWVCFVRRDPNSGYSMESLVLLRCKIHSVNIPNIFRFWSACKSK